MRRLPELLVLRHGETEWNRAGRFQGERDSPLTPLGRAQAEALGQLLGAEGVSDRTHAAWTSPQGRAAETAKVALGPLGIEAREDARLVEIAMGGWTGLSRGEVDRGWPPVAGEGVLGFYARCPGGERLEAVAARAGAALAAVEGPTVLVTHGITLRVLCALALGLAPGAAEGIVVPQGSLARLRDGGLTVLHPPLPASGPEARPLATGG
jgi:probable phosphoglycerate mutase